MLSRAADLERAYTDFRNRHARTAGNLTRKNTRRAYDRVYGDERLFDEYLAPDRVDFLRELAAVAARLAPRSVLDVGCGAGNLLHELVERAALERVVGVDYASAGIRRAARLVPSGEFHAVSVYRLDLEERFELVLCTEVLEHLSRPRAAVERLVQHCAASGTVLITVPDGGSDTWEGHRNFWTDAELEEFLQPYGDVEVTRLGGDLLALLRPRPAGAA